MSQKRNKKRRFFFKGSIVVFALMLMFILSITAIGIISTASIERKVSISTSSSTNAFQVAESGMEKTLQYFKSNFDKTLNDINGAANCSGGKVFYGLNTSTIKFKSNATTYINNCNALISDVRIIKSIGTTKQETQAVEENVFLGATKLLLHFDGVSAADEDHIDDSSYYYYKNQDIVLKDDAKIVPDVKKNGLASVYFDGIKSYISIPESDDWNFGTGDFTIDFWIRTAGIPVNSTYIEIGSEDSDKLLIYQKDSNNLCFLIGGSESCKSFSPSINTSWEHIALVRNKEDKVKIFVNGTQKGSTEDNSSNIAPTNNRIFIGGSSKSSQFFNGYIDELRISKGIARWGSVSSFTPSEVGYFPD